MLIRLIWRVLLIVAILGLFGWVASSKGLKKGIDLAGGTTLVYDVTIPENRTASEVLADTIGILRDRVDPTGTKNLTWRTVAGNRIEVQMPQPGEQVAELKAAWEQAHAAVLVGNIDASALDRAIDLAIDGQDAELHALAGDDAASLDRLSNLVTLTGESQTAEQAFRSAERFFNTIDPTLEDAERDAILSMEASYRQFESSQQALRQAKTSLLNQNIPESQLQSLYDLSDKARTVPEGETAPPSPRDTMLQQLVERYPVRETAIRALDEAYANYEGVKGALDDANDLKLLLQGSGVLELRIAEVPQGNFQLRAQEYIDQLDSSGPRAGRDKDARWFPVDDLENFIDNETRREAVLTDLDAALAMGDPDPQRAAEARDAAQRVTQALSAMGFIGRPYGGELFLLLGNEPENAMRGTDDWELTDVFVGVDEFNRPAVNFNMDARGQSLLAAITEPHVGMPMAVMLDGSIVTAPNLRGALTGGGGQITGRFSERELSYMIRSMKAGSLEGQLSPEPISEKTTGPQLGQDNLAKGIRASILSIIVVAAFMLLYYLFAGAVADIALAANMIIILGVMSAIEATFTLPGIAGLVLTIGMAVDANVLIFERIREELDDGRETHVAVKEGFAKALSTILDANITTLITCLVLGYTATAEVKGFAVVLGIGILATLFTALFMSRVLLLDFAVDLLRARKMPMLPTLMPALNKVLKPKIDWVGLRHIFVPISAVLIVAGVLTAFLRGADILDIEFRSGTQVVYEMKPGQGLPIGEARQLLADASEVAVLLQAGQGVPAELAPLADRVRPVVEDAQQRYRRRVEAAETAFEAGVTEEEPNEAPPDFTLLQDAAAGALVTVGDAEGDVYTGFAVSTLMTDADSVSGIIKAAYGEALSTTRPVGFRGATAQTLAETGGLARRVSDPDLGESLQQPGLTRDVSPFLGGAVFVLDGLEPPTSVQTLERKIRRQVNLPPHDSLPFRQREVIGLDRAAELGPDEDGNARYRRVAVLVADEVTNYNEDPTSFDAPGGMAASEWTMLRDAMAAESSLRSVTKFDSQVSGTMQQQAIAAMTLSLLAVVVYIWFRFGSITYGFAAIAALVHDVTLTLGLVAICGWISETGIAKAFLLDPFKIDLAMVAAFLTIVGYSLNDTIVVFDRIRENRGKLARATPEILNRSINQTISRTVLTSGTTLIAVGILYFFGGPGVHGFAFAMLIGVLVGTYSSIAVAAPLLLYGSKAGKGVIDRGGDPKPGGGAALPATT